MKTGTQVMQPRKGVVHKIASIVMFSGPIRRFGIWLEHKLKVDLYETRGDEIVSVRHQLQRFKVRDVVSFQQAFIDFGLPVIILKFADGKTMELNDKHQHLLRLLQKMSAEKEMPWTAVTQ